MGRSPIRRGTVGAAALAAALTGCVSYAQLYAPDGTLDEARAAAIGHTLYRRRCALCHTPFEPSQYAMAAWDGQLRKYGARAGLTREERRFVRLYLDSHAPDGERRTRLAAATAAAPVASDGRDG